MAILLTVIAFPNAISQEFHERGLPYIQNFSPQQYGAESQNFAGIQSNEELVYIGNAGGVLEYDGASWRLIELPNKGIVRSLAIAGDNTIYVGGYNELGYLKSNPSGTMEFVSLKKFLPEGEKEFQLVRSIEALGDQVYFQTRERIFLWENGSFNILPSAAVFNFCKVVANELYVVENNINIRKLVDGKFIDIASLTVNSTEIIVDLLASTDGYFLALTHGSGIFRVKGGIFTPFAKEIKPYLSVKNGRKISRLSNGWIVIGTLSGGIVFLDEMGNPIQTVDKTSGLTDNHVLGMFEDHQQGLWIATNNGIARSEAAGPFTIFDQRSGIEGYVNSIYRHKGDLYIANYKGVMRLQRGKGPGISWEFQLVSKLFENAAGAYSQAFYFLGLGDTLMLASRAGTFFMVDGKLTKRFDYASSALYRSRKDVHRIFIGLYDGLASLVYSGGDWKDDGRIDGIKDDIREIIEDKDGVLWLESQTEGVWKIKFSEGNGNPEIKHFRPNRELPSGTLFLRFVRGEPLFVIDGNPYRYEKSKDSIIPDPDLSNILGVKGSPAVKMEDKNGSIWMHAKTSADENQSVRIRADKTPGGSYLLNVIDDSRISQEVGTALFQENNRVVWYGGSGGLVRHDLSIDNHAASKFKTHIRRVTIRNDSLLYGGIGIDSLPPQLNYQDNALRIQFAGTSFDAKDRNSYQYRLEGFDESWSEWTPETQKDYTNIPEGNYTFRVRAKNVYGYTGEEASYSFLINPPWQRSWWAYISYGIGAVLLLLLISNMQSKELRRKNELLENKVRARTRDIRAKNKQLLQQKEQLAELNLAKTNLYSNITHEFRTPLTVILGMADNLSAEVAHEKLSNAQNSLELIRRNGTNLLSLVNEMLEVAKSENGQMKLEMVEADVIPLIRYTVESFNSLAEDKDLSIKVSSDVKSLVMDVDIAKLTAIVTNLVANAIKFTPPGGNIAVDLSRKSYLKRDCLSIYVKDDGVGIEQEAQSHIFKRFYQVETSARSGQGNGLGLALSQEMAEMMNGHIGVKSKLGKGSEFYIYLPVTHNFEKKIEEAFNSTIAEKVFPAEWKPEFRPQLPLVLIIEDNKDVAYYLKSCLDENYETMHAADGESGLQMAFEKVPDIIICDVMMPGISGYEVCNSLKRDVRTDHIPIVMLTAKVTTEDKLTGLSHGADAYLAKPFDKQELHIRMEQLLLLRKKLIGKINKKGFEKLLADRADDPRSRFLHKAVISIREEMSHPDFGPTQLAALLALSESQLYRKLKTITGKSTALFIRSIRLMKAKELLATTHLNVSEVAYEVGFNDPSWFSRAFKKEFGITPGNK